MGEYYWGDLEMTFPETLVIKDLDLTLAVDEDLLRCIFEDDKDDGVTLGDFVTQRLGLDGDDVRVDTVWEWVDEELSQLAAVTEGADEIAVARLTVEIGGEHNYGCAFYYDNTDIEERCQRLGIAYRMWDDGKYEIPGEERMWSPDLEASLVRSHSPEGVVLAAGEADGMWDAAEGDDAKFGRLVRAYFCPLEAST